MSTVSSRSPSAVVRNRMARSGARVSSALTESAVRWVTTASRAPDVAKMTMSSAPSKTCPMAAAAIAATIMSRSTSRVRSRAARSPASAGSQPPVP